MGELQGIVRFRFHAGMVEEFKRLSAECLEVVRTKDAGTLQYDTYFNEDETACVVLERFRDSDALILHSENMAPLMDSIMATGTVSGELLGDLSDDLRAQMGGSPVGLFTLYQSLAGSDGGSVDDLAGVETMRGVDAVEERSHHRDTRG